MQQHNAEVSGRSNKVHDKFLKYIFIKNWIIFMRKCPLQAYDSLLLGYYGPKT